MAPFDRCPKGSLTFGGVARAAREKRQGAIEALQERLRAEKLRACSGELDRERQAVETATDRLDSRIGHEVFPDPAGSFQEERHRIVRRQWLEWVLTLREDPQRRSASHDHPQPVSGSEERREVRRSREQMFEVVEQQQQLLFPAQIAKKVVAGRERSCDLRQDELGIGQAGERNPEHSVRERADQFGRDLQRESGLTRPAWAGDSHQARPLREQRHELL